MPLRFVAVHGHFYQPPRENPWLEAVEVQGLSRETSEDVFGRWSGACSLVGQSGGLELLLLGTDDVMGFVDEEHGSPFSLTSTSV